MIFKSSILMATLVYIDIFLILLQDIEELQYYWAATWISRGYGNVENLVSIVATFSTIFCLLIFQKSSWKCFYANLWIIQHSCMSQDSFSSSCVDWHNRLRWHSWYGICDFFFIFFIFKFLDYKQGKYVPWSYELQKFLFFSLLFWRHCSFKIEANISNPTILEMLAGVNILSLVLKKYKNKDQG
jgi:hypothetical protein